MVNWIFILILAVFVGVNSHTIVYPGKSALLSYSPARGEFPVESLFRRGFFSYIDNQGISRTINLEPNPLLGVRVSNEGKLSTGSEDTTDLRKDGSLSNTQKGDRLKPIKEFDERPFQDSITEQDNGSGSKLVESSQQQIKGDKNYGEQILSVTVPKQQEQILFYPATGNVPVQNLGLQPDRNVYFTSQNTGMPIAQPVFSSENPFINKQLGVLVQNPSTISDMAAVKQAIPSQQQITLYPQTGSTSGQLLLIAPKLTNSVGQGASSRELQDINSADAQVKQEIPSTNNLTPQRGEAQSFVSTPITNPSLAAQAPAAIRSSETEQDQLLRQTLPNSSAAAFHALSSPLATPNSATLINTNPFFPPSRQPPPPKPQEVLMIQQTNPFLFMNNNKNQQLAWPTPSPTTTTTPGPLFIDEQKNPFLPITMGTIGQQVVPTIQVQQIPMQPSLQLEPGKPASTVCDYLSVGPIPEQIKDTSEVEKAKREHFLAHQMALAQLAEARQDKDNSEKQTNDSSLNSDNSAPYLTANSPLDQTVTSGSTTTAFEQTTVSNAESEILNA